MPSLPVISHTERGGNWPFFDCAGWWLKYGIARVEYVNMSHVLTGGQPLNSVDLTTVDVVDGNAFRKALTSAAFFMNYQPQIAFKGERLLGFESLVRWKLPNGQAMRPDLFIPYAESNDLMMPLGEQIIKMVVANVALINAAGYKGLHYAINLSARQLQDMETLRLIQSQLAESGVPPKSIHFELTESALIENEDTAVAIVRGLRALGCEIWVDDFGTGYSSLSMLRKYPLAGVKIDKQFVDDIETSEADFMITSSIIAMAHGLGQRVVAEGVETSAQGQILSHIGCDVLQGYYYGRPKVLNSYMSRIQLGK